MGRNKKNHKRPDKYLSELREERAIIPPIEPGVEIVLKQSEKQTVTIPLEEYKAFVESVFAIKIFKSFLKTAKYSCDIAEFAKELFGTDNQNGGDRNES